MLAAFAERLPNAAEIEKFRLILSTFQDGSRMLAVRESNRPAWIVANRAATLPGWRDFERVVALTFGGRAIESKWIYDVLLSDHSRPELHFGISCKMRGELRKANRPNGRATIELSNAAGEFWGAIKTRGQFSEETYADSPEVVGAIILDLVNGWHQRVDSQLSGIVETDKSCFLNLLWDRNSGQYQLLQFPIHLPDAAHIAWRVSGRRLIGNDSEGIIFEWYGHSGGQLKYYPLVRNALWQSHIFKLEPLSVQVEDIAISKAATYFPTQWKAVTTQYSRE